MSERFLARNFPARSQVCIIETSRSKPVVMSLTKPEQHDRSKIDLGSARQAKSWAHTLGVTKDELRCVVDKVGNSAALVKREIERLRQHERDLCANEGPNGKQGSATDRSGN